MAEPRRQRTPVTILGGYLGAGKTTLLNAVLRADHGQRIAVIVNDFGSVNIDASLISSRTADRIDLANGCACCELGESVADAFMALADAVPQFDRVIMEASGVAMPQTLAGWATLPGLVLDGVVVAADALNIAEQVVDRLIGDTVRRQIRGADLGVITKADIADAAMVSRAQGVVAEVDPDLPVLISELPMSLNAIFGLPRRASSLSGPDLEALDDMHADHCSTVWRPETPVDVARLCDALAGVPGLVRAKGPVRSSDGSLKLVQLVGRRVAVSDWTSGPTETTLVLIGPLDRFDPSAALAVLESFRKL